MRRKGANEKIYQKADVSAQNCSMNTDKIGRYVWIGRKDQHWYRECRAVFVELFGEDRLDLVTKLFAATSINTSLKSNITLFRKALNEIERGVEPGRYLPNIRNQIIKIRAGGELSGRKIFSFQQAMSGNKNSVVVDIWLLRAFGMDKKYFRVSKGKAGMVKPEAGLGQLTAFELELISERPDPRFGRFRSGGPTDREYTMIENYVRQEAGAMGLDPCQLSAMIWAGCRIDTNGDRETHYANILRRHFKNIFDTI